MQPRIEFCVDAGGIVRVRAGHIDVGERDDLGVGVVKLSTHTARLERRGHKAVLTTAMAGWVGGWVGWREGGEGWWSGLKEAARPED